MCLSTYNTLIFLKIRLCRVEGLKESRVLYESHTSLKQANLPLYDATNRGASNSIPPFPVDGVAYPSD